MADASAGDIFAALFAARHAGDYWCPDLAAGSGQGPAGLARTPRLRRPRHVDGLGRGLALGRASRHRPPSRRPESARNATPPAVPKKPSAAPSAMDKARAAISANPGLTDKQVARKAGVSVRTVVRAKKGLEGAK